MPSPIHPTMRVRKEGDRYLFGPIGWAAKMPEKVYATRQDAMNALIAIRRVIPCPLCVSFGPREAL